MAIRGYIDASVKILADDMNAPHLLDEGGVTDIVSENVGDIIEDRAEEIFNEELHPETVAAVQAIAGGGGGGIVYTAGEGIDITSRVISVSDDFQEQVTSAQSTADAAIETANEANGNATSALSIAEEASGEAASAATTANQALEAVNGKQDMLIAGEGITIDDNVISATGGGGSSEWHYSSVTNTTTGTAHYINLGALNLGEDWEELQISGAWDNVGDATANTGYVSFLVSDYATAISNFFVGPVSGKSTRFVLTVYNLKKGFDTTANRVYLRSTYEYDTQEKPTSTSISYGTNTVRCSANTITSNTDASVNLQTCSFVTPNNLKPITYYIKWR